MVAAISSRGGQGPVLFAVRVAYWDEFPTLSLMLYYVSISLSNLNLLGPKLCRLHPRTASCTHITHSEVPAMALDLGRVNDALAAQDASFPFWNRSLERIEPPPPYSSGETTRYSSPEHVRSEDIPRMPAWLRAICLENAEPRNQFASQYKREGDRIHEATLEKVRKGIIKFRDINDGKPVDFHELGRQSVEADWREQGIWIENWTGNVNAMVAWKHQLPLDSDTESESECEEQPRSSLFGLPSPPRKPHKKPNATELLQKLPARLERRRQKECDGEASKPLYQFKHQVDKEREYIQEQVAHGKRREVGDIDEMAYHTVRNWWIDQRIWFSKWQPLPGMQWMNEMPSEDVADEDAFTITKYDLPDATLPESPVPFRLVSQEGIGTPNQRDEPLNVIEPPSSTQSHAEVNSRRPDGQSNGNSRSASPEVPTAEPALPVKRSRRAGRLSNSKATPTILKPASSRDPANSNRVVKHRKQVARYQGSEDRVTSPVSKSQPEFKLRRSKRIEGLVARLNQRPLDTGNAPKACEGPQAEHHTGHQEQSAGASKKRAPASHLRRFQTPEGVSLTAPRQQKRPAVTEAKPWGVTKKRTKKGRRKTTTER